MTCMGNFFKNLFVIMKSLEGLHWKQKCGEVCDGSYLLWASSGPWPGSSSVLL